jgi:hypothetical protein
MGAQTNAPAAPANAKPQVFLLTANKPPMMLRSIPRIKTMAKREAINELPPNPMSRII